MIRLANIFIFLVLASLWSCKINKELSVEKELNRTIKKLISIHGQGQFNGSILLAKGPHILLRQHHGFIDIQKTKLIDGQSRFNIGSAAKEIPAMAILDLIEKGKVDYKDTIAQYLDHLPPWAGRITIRDLLFYESGLPPINFLTSNSDDHAKRDLKKIDALLFEPGEGYLYSNWNNFLQAKIVESVVKMDFRLWAKQYFFDPLEMNDAVYTSNPPDITNNITRSYSQEYGDDILNNPRFKHFELCYAPLYMTTMDLFKWIEYVHQKYQTGGKGIAGFFQPSSLNRQGPLGIIKQEGDIVRFHIHGGAAYSFEIQTYKDYQKELTIILMTNNSTAVDLEELRDEVLKIL